MDGQLLVLVERLDAVYHRVDVSQQRVTGTQLLTVEQPGDGSILLGSSSLVPLLQLGEVAVHHGTSLSSLSTILSHLALHELTGSQSHLALFVELREDEVVEDVADHRHVTWTNVLVIHPAQHVLHDVRRHDRHIDLALVVTDGQRSELALTLRRPEWNELLQHAADSSLRGTHLHLVGDDGRHVLRGGGLAHQLTEDLQAFVRHILAELLLEFCSINGRITRIGSALEHSINELVVAQSHIRLHNSLGLLLPLNFLTIVNLRGSFELNDSLVFLSDDSFEFLLSLLQFGDTLTRLCQGSSIALSLSLELCGKLLGDGVLSSTVGSLVILQVFLEDLQERLTVLLVQLSTLLVGEHGSPILILSQRRQAQCLKHGLHSESEQTFLSHRFYFWLIYSWTHNFSLICLVSASATPRSPMLSARPTSTARLA